MSEFFIISEATQAVLEKTSAVTIDRVDPGVLDKVQGDTLDPELRLEDG